MEEEFQKKKIFLQNQGKKDLKAEDGNVLTQL